MVLFGLKYVLKMKFVTIERNKFYGISQRNTEVDAKWAQKKEELRKEIRKNNNFLSGKY